MSLKVVSDSYIIPKGAIWLFFVSSCLTLSEILQNKAFVFLVGVSLFSECYFLSVSEVNQVSTCDGSETHTYRVWIVGLVGLKFVLNHKNGIWPTWSSIRNIDAEEQNANGLCDAVLLLPLHRYTAWLIYLLTMSNFELDLDFLFSFLIVLWFVLS